MSQLFTPSPLTLAWQKGLFQGFLFYSRQPQPMTAHSEWKRAELYSLNLNYSACLLWHSALKTYYDGGNHFKALFSRDIRNVGHMDRTTLHPMFCKNLSLFTHCASRGLEP